MRINDLSEGKSPIASWLIHGTEEPGKFFGKYCEIHYRILSEDEEGHEGFYIPYWDKIGHNAEPATDEEWLAHQISRIPEADYLVSFRTSDQFEHWIGCKDQAIELAYCFLTEPGQPNDKLLKEFELGAIDQFSYEYGWASANLYKSFWKVLKKDGPRIVKALRSYKERYLFNSSRELMAEIVKEVYEGEFYRCLKRQSIYVANQITELAKLKRKQCKEGLSDQEQKKLFELMDRHIPHAELYDNTLALAQEIAKKDPLTRTLLEAFYKSIDLIAKLQIQRECNPKLRQKHGPKSHTWKQGKKVEGSPSWRA